MNNENFIDLVIYHLVSNNITTYDTIYQNKTFGNISYTSLKFKYNHRKIECRIYNTNFINIRIDNVGEKICTSFNQLKEEIDRMQNLLSLSR